MQQRVVAEAREMMRVEMGRKAIKKVVLIIQQLFGLDIWPLACAKNETCFCRTLSLGLSGARVGQKATPSALLHQRKFWK